MDLAKPFVQLRHSRAVLGGAHQLPEGNPGGVPSRKYRPWVLRRSVVIVSRSLRPTGAFPSPLRTHQPGDAAISALIFCTVLVNPFPVARVSEPPSACCRARHAIQHPVD